MSEEEFYDVELTDIQLHVQAPRKPVSFERAVSKVLNNPHKSEGRVYSKGISPSKKDNSFSIELPMPTNIAKLEKIAKKQGKKLRFLVPEGGLPVYPGKDALEYLQAKVKRENKSLTKKSGKVK